MSAIVMTPALMELAAGVGACGAVVLMMTALRCLARAKDHADDDERFAAEYAELKKLHDGDDIDLDFGADLTYQLHVDPKG